MFKVAVATVYFEQAKLDFYCFVKQTRFVYAVRHLIFVSRFVVNCQTLNWTTLSHKTTSNALWEYKMAAFTFNCKIAL